MGLRIQNDFENEYISLTDIAKYRNDNDLRFVIQNWMRNRNTVEFLAVWEELHNSDFNTILGSGITRMDDSALMQQELLDVIISTYKLSASKIKKPNKLIIACKRVEDFSLYKIGEYI